MRLKEGISQNGSGDHGDLSGHGPVDFGADHTMRHVARGGHVQRNQLNRSQADAVRADKDHGVGLDLLFTEINC